MRIKFKYKYQVYPNSPRATKYSEKLARATSLSMCCVYGLFWFCIFYMGIILNFRVSMELAVGLSAASLLILFILIKIIRSKVQAKIEKIAKEDLQ